MLVGSEQNRVRDGWVCLKKGDGGGEEQLEGNVEGSLHYHKAQASLEKQGVRARAKRRGSRAGESTPEGQRIFAIATSESNREKEKWNKDALVLRNTQMWSEDVYWEEAQGNSSQTLSTLYFNTVLCLLSKSW